MTAEKADSSAEIARQLVHSALSGTLATAEADGHPFASLVGLAPGPDGAPLMLLSGLARHTRNLAADPRASLLLRADGTGGDPLAEARLTLVGTVGPVDPGAAAAARQSYLARHPAAAAYSGFGDFAFYRMAVASAYLVAGFGRIESLAGDRLAAVLSHKAE